MESSSGHPRFRFRDHQTDGNLEDSIQSDSSSDVNYQTSTPSYRDDDLQLESMTAKGIKHLCSDLVELKESSCEDFQKNILANYAAFVRIIEEVKGVENEIRTLKTHFETQKELVRDLMDGILLKIPKDTIHSIIQEDADALPSPPSELHMHMNDVSEALDVLISENRIDEALDILEQEDEFFQNINFEDDSLLADLMLYKSMITERRDMLILQLTLLAENPRIVAAELQQALVGLCRLGDSDLAMQLLLKYYNSRIVAGIHRLQSSKSSSQGIYIRELARFLFSMVSQAARSFVMLFGEASPYVSEFIQWAFEETKAFVDCFSEHVASISEGNGALSTCIEAAESAVSFCSLLEEQDLVLCPYLVKHICPFMEEVLCKQINHFKRSIAISSASDTWALNRYYVSEVVGEEHCSSTVQQESQICLLTSGGRKFLKMIQEIAENVYPFITFQMEGSVFRGLVDLFKEYVFILESALNSEANLPESARVKPANSMPQRVSILANLSTVSHLSCITIEISFGDKDPTENPSVDSRHNGVDSFRTLADEAYNELRGIFCKQFISELLNSHELAIELDNCKDDDKTRVSETLTPSSVFQVLFLELRKLERLQYESNVLEAEWLMDLLRELIQEAFAWYSKNNKIPETSEENSQFFEKIYLDVQFLAEIATLGGYFSDNLTVLVNLMTSTLDSFGLDSNREIDNDGWARDEACSTIDRLLKIEKRKLTENEGPVGTFEEEVRENRNDKSGESSACDAGSSSDYYVEPEEEMAPTDESEFAMYEGSLLHLLELEEDPARASRRGTRGPAFEESSVELEDDQVQHRKLDQMGKR